MTQSFAGNLRSSSDQVEFPNGDRVCSRTDRESAECHPVDRCRRRRTEIRRLEQRAVRLDVRIAGDVLRTEPRDRRCLEAGGGGENHHDGQGNPKSAERHKQPDFFFEDFRWFSERRERVKLRATLEVRDRRPFANFFQSLDGGVVSKILVKEGQIVQKGQLLLNIDNTRFVSSLNENQAQYLSLLAKAAQERIMTDRFRVYTNSDMTGVEWAGALKNVIGIAAGICDGLELGDNAKAAMLTRGLAEIARSGEALGADPATFSGLAGVRDLLTTCFSPHGRNRRLGHRIGRGESLEAALGAGRQVVEGVNTVRALAPLAKSRGWDMPICQGVHDVLFGDISPRHAVENLLLRAPRPEFIPKQGKNA